MGMRHLSYATNRGQVQLRKALKEGKLDLLQLVVHDRKGLSRELVKIVVC